MMHKLRFTFATAMMPRLKSRAGRTHWMKSMVLGSVAAMGWGTALAYDAQSTVTIPEKSTRVFDLYVTEIARSRNPWQTGENYWTNEMVLQITDGDKGNNTEIVQAVPMVTRIQPTGFVLMDTRSDTCVVTRYTGNRWTVKQSGPLNGALTGPYPIAAGGTAMQCKIVVRVSNSGEAPQIRVREGSMQAVGNSGSWVREYYSVCLDPTCAQGGASLIGHGGITGWTASAPVNTGSVQVTQPAASLSVRYNRQISLSRGQSRKPAIFIEGTGTANAKWGTDNQTGFLLLRDNNNKEWRPGSTITMRGGDTYDAMLVPSDSMPWGTMRENWTLEWSIQ